MPRVQLGEGEGSRFGTPIADFLKTPLERRDVQTDAETASCYLYIRRMLCTSLHLPTVLAFAKLLGK